MLVGTAFSQDNKPVRVAVYPFKYINNVDEQYNRLQNDNVGRLIITKIKFSTNADILPYDYFVSLLKQRGIDPKKDYSVANQRYHLEYLHEFENIDYVISGSVNVVEEKFSVVEKLTKITDGKIEEITDTLDPKENIKSYDINDMNKIYDIVDNLTDTLLEPLISKNILEYYDDYLAKEQNAFRKLFPSTNIDIMLLLDSTGSMADEIEVLQKTINKIKLDIASLNYANIIRFGFVDFKDINDPKSDEPSLFDFTEDINQVENYLNNTIKAGEGVDSKYEDIYEGLKKAISSDASWSDADNAIQAIILMTDAEVKPEEIEDFKANVKKLIEKDIKLYVIGASAISPRARQFYTAQTRRTGGDYQELVYKFSYKDKSSNQFQTNFIYQNNYIYKQKRISKKREWYKDSYLEEENLKDISLGRRVNLNNPEELVKFLELEGYEISDNFNESISKIDNNIDDIIYTFIKSNFRQEQIPAPRMLIESNNYKMFIYISDRKLYEHLAKYDLKDVELLIGGQIVPTNNDYRFNFNPNTIIVTQLQEFIPETMIVDLQQIIENRYIFVNYGLFKKNKWFIRAKIKRLEANF